MLDDRWLIWRLKRGSAQALRRLYGKYEADLLNVAANLLGRSDQAQDVLQDVFIQFIKTIDTFELTGSLKGYLATCVANRARDLRRRDRRRPTGPARCRGRLPMSSDSS
jgi:RNA polymerase sigma factor (sigma-70 family)